MAVIVGGTSGAKAAYDRARDNPADRLLALWQQIGDPSTLVPDHGTVLSIRRGSGVVEIEVGLNVFGDGQTYGGVDRRLTSVTAPFTKSMLGLPIKIFGYGSRVVEAVNSTSEIEYSGLAVDAGTGRRFTQPLGRASFFDGQISGGNTLTSASEPFYPDLTGRPVVITDLGVRTMTYVSATTVTFDGAAVADRIHVHFTVPVILGPEERSMETAGGQVVDSHRVDEISTPTTILWRFGARPLPATPRTVV